MKTRLSIIKEQVENILEVVLVGKAAQAAVAKPAPAGIRMSEEEKAAAKAAEEAKKANLIQLAKARYGQQGREAGTEAATPEGGRSVSRGLVASSTGARGEERTFNPDRPGSKGIGGAHEGRAHTKTKRQIAAGNLKQGGKRTRFSPRAVPVKTVR
jgi:hypothetical protein